MVAMTVQHATKPLTIARRRWFWHGKSEHFRWRIKLNHY
ncbi:hypothetical protein FH063_000412 [Azospirillum argentinense]|uniref:Uncharacterized protein n=1 Tax=Azospirillum argentinense TaxID=2970906 RepID=A0A5B0L044_9PROT|nr:hypothetical protein FH063_000412 [Azospirillum argentinense]